VAEINTGCQLCKDKDIGKDDNQFLFEIHALVTGRALLLKHALLLHQILFAYVHDPNGDLLVPFDDKSNAKDIAHGSRNADFRL